MTEHGKVVRLVSAEGKNRTLELDDGSIVVRSGGTASWRNNNPGNLKFEYAGSADRTVHAGRSYAKALRVAQDMYPGVVALDQWGNAVFETLEAGRAAQLQLLRRRFADSTVEEMVSGYSKADYSGPTHHATQLKTIYQTGDAHGIELRHRRLDRLSDTELAVLGDGISKFEGFKPGTVEVRNGTARSSSAVAAAPAPPTRVEPTSGRLPSHAIYDEAALHFLSGGNRFEYGRPDAPRPGRDPSRLERDGDGDGRLGVDCSAFVWRGLKNAGFDVRGQDASGFSTHTLFSGTAPTPYARAHFDVIGADAARRPNGSLERGDLLLFSDGHSQHIAIFKGYDSSGRLHFVGSQGTTGPREVTIEPHGYWDGATTRIVGALRAKPEFQVRSALHDTGHDRRLAAPGSVHGPAVMQAGEPHARMGTPGHAATPTSEPSRRTPVDALQHRLNALGARDAAGVTLIEDGVAGRHTRDALRGFQREHGLPASGHAGHRTLAAMAAPHGLRISDHTHPDYPLFEKTLGLVANAEARQGIPMGAHTENLAAALVVQMRRDGLHAIDRVDLSDPPRFARAVQVIPGASAQGELVSMPIDTQVASRQSLHASSDALASLPRPRPQSAETLVAHQTRAVPHQETAPTHVVSR